MPRFWTKTVLTALVCLMPVVSGAQGRTTGQIVGIVKDASGAVVPKPSSMLIDTATGTTSETKSGADGGFVFPNLQPGRYPMTATFQGFNPVTIQQVVVETSRSVNIVVQFQVAGVTEQVNVEGRTSVVETTSTTVSNTVSERADCEAAASGRNILDFALLVPGATQSTGGRDSEFNGLPGGAINITLDGVNNNSARFRSGGTSMFVFAPVRLGAIEEVTVSTAGPERRRRRRRRDADPVRHQARVQHVPRAGVRPVSAATSSNANSWVNEARGIPKTKLRQHEYGANVGGPIIKNKLFFFGNYEQIYQPGETTRTRTRAHARSAAGHLPLQRQPTTSSAPPTSCEIAAANGFQGDDRSVHRRSSCRSSTTRSAGGNVVVDEPVPEHFSYIDPNTPNTNIYPTARVDYQASSSLAIRGVLNLHWRDLPTQTRSTRACRKSARASPRRTTSSRPAPTGRSRRTCSIRSASACRATSRSSGPATRSPSTTRRAGAGSSFRSACDSPQITNDQMPIPRNNPVYNISNTFTYIRGTHTYTFGGTFRRTTMYESIGGAPLSGQPWRRGGRSRRRASSTRRPCRACAARTWRRARSLYAFLTGRISSASGQNALNRRDTQEYGVNPAFRREAQNVGGVFAQDQWRLTPELTLNYGLRWEFSGAATNPNEVYSSPTPADICSARRRRPSSRARSTASPIRR